MMKYVVLLALSLFTSLSGWAFSLDNADIRLLCPQRGQIEVILHRYEHTQQSWGQHHFETGGGHVRQGPLLVIPFALPKIGRAVQQECRDRSRMPSSA